MTRTSYCVLIGRVRALARWLDRPPADQGERQILRDLREYTTRLQAADCPAKTPAESQEATEILELARAALVAAETPAP